MQTPEQIIPTLGDLSQRKCDAEYRKVEYPLGKNGKPVVTLDARRRVWFAHRWPKPAAKPAVADAETPVEPDDDTMMAD